MARKEKEFQITEDGRDKGKLYLIKEMSAFETEKWAMRTVNAIMRNLREDEVETYLVLFYSYLNSLNKPPVTQEEQVEKLKEAAQKDDIIISSPAEILALNFFNTLLSLPYDDYANATGPLLECCYSVVDLSRQSPPPNIMSNIDIYCEEVPTIFELRKQAFLLHLDFFIAAVKQNLEKFTANQQNP